jgi:hypothetical protein
VRAAAADKEILILYPNPAKRNKSFRQQIFFAIKREEIVKEKW